jgi:FdrA protein
LEIKTIIKKNSYFDSVTLMRITGQVSKLQGVLDVLVGMGTELNKDSLRNIGLLTPELEGASPNDLMIGIKAEDEKAMEEALRTIDELFAAKGKGKKSRKEENYERIEQVAKLNEGYNMAVISVPGVYAAREAKNALNNGMHVFLFSDNVTVEEEIELKDLALQKGLLMMGPDCGTAIINGVPLGFANRVRKGNIGIVGASGTGLQHVTTLIHALGGGITQAVGTGGRDLSAKVQGRTLLAVLEALEEDANTDVIVIISKPPAPEVAEKVLNKARSLSKKVVLCLLGSKSMENLGDNIVQCSNIEEAAFNAVSLALGIEVELKNSEEVKEQVESFLKERRPEQKYVRGIFGGGTLCDEAMTVFRRRGVPMYSNIPLSEEERLESIDKSRGNTFIDMGDDYFTRGKPHPMIEPGLRTNRIIQDALDPETAVMLLDVVLGHGSHPDPAGVAAEAAVEANRRLREQGRKVLWIAALVGTDEDPQGYDSQKQKLKDAGFVICESNVRAAELAASLAARFEKGGEYYEH